MLATNASREQVGPYMNASLGCCMPNTDLQKLVSAIIREDWIVLTDLKVDWYEIECIPDLTLPGPNIE